MEELSITGEPASPRRGWAAVHLCSVRQSAARRMDGPFQFSRRRLSLPGSMPSCPMLLSSNFYPGWPWKPTSKLGCRELATKLGQGFLRGWKNRRLRASRQARVAAGQLYIYAKRRADAQLSLSACVCGLAAAWRWHGEGMMGAWCVSMVW